MAPQYLCSHADTARAHTLSCTAKHVSSRAASLLWHPSVSDSRTCCSFAPLSVSDPPALFDPWPHVFWWPQALPCLSPFICSRFHTHLTLLQAWCFAWQVPPYECIFLAVAKCMLHIDRYLAQSWRACGVPVWACTWWRIQVDPSSKCGGTVLLKKFVLQLLTESWVVWEFLSVPCTLLRNMQSQAWLFLEGKLHKTIKITLPKGLFQSKFCSLN